EWMGASRSVVCRDVRPFHVQPRNRRMGELQQCLRASREAIDRRCDESRQIPRDAGLSQRIGGMLKLCGSATGRVEIDPGKPINLKVKETWGFDSHWKFARV